MGKLFRSVVITVAVFMSPGLVAAEQQSYAAHVSSLKSQKQAENEWAKISSAHGDILESIDPIYKKIDIPGKGIFIRLYAGVWPSKAEAQDICRKLKARNLYCSPIKSKISGTTTKGLSTTRPQEKKRGIAIAKKSAPKAVQQSSADGEYLRVTGATVNIRFAPNASSDVVAKAEENDIFKLSSEEGMEKGDWYSVLLFAGEWRYIHKSLAKRTQSQSQMPTERVKRKLFNSMRNIERRAMDEADRMFSPKDYAKNIDYQRVLIDRYKLDLFRKFNVQPTHAEEIILEGIGKKWRN